MNVPDNIEHNEESTPLTSDVDGHGPDAGRGHHSAGTASTTVRTPEPSDAPRSAAPADPSPGAADYNQRGLGGRGRIVGHREIVARATTTPTGPEPAPSTHRKSRSMTLPPDLIDRITESGMKPAELILRAAKRYGDELQHTARYIPEGHVRFTVRLNDQEHDELTTIAQRRGWPVSSTVAVLLELYLTEIEAALNKRPKWARAKP